MRRFLLSNTLNTRDLGGYPIDNEKLTTYKMFIRSDVPNQVSNYDINILLSNNITTIVDLRNDNEVQSNPCALKNNKNFEYYHCKVYGDGRLPESAEDVANSYFEIVDEQRTVLNVMKIFAKAKGGVLYHCSAGKDRTGVISALLLLLAGACKTDIISDYQISGVYLRDMLQQYYESNKNVDLNIITPKMEYMSKFLDMFQQKYNTVEEYFYQIGLSNSEILQLKTRLIGSIR